MGRPWQTPVWGDSDLWRLGRGADLGQSWVKRSGWCYARVPGRVGSRGQAPLCLDARGNSALRVSCGLERLSGGSGGRGYLFSFTSSAPAGAESWPATHARPGPGRDPVSGPVPLSLTYQRARPSATGPRGRAPTVSAKG